MTLNQADPSWKDLTEKDFMKGLLGWSRLKGPTRI